MYMTPDHTTIATNNPSDGALMPPCAARVALNPTPHLVVDRALITQLEHRAAFSIDHGATYQAVLDQFLLGVRVADGVMRVIVAQPGHARVLLPADRRRLCSGTGSADLRRSL